MAREDLPPERILLVEGADDEEVVRHLCQRHHSVPAFGIENKHGFPALRRAIVPEMKVSARRAVGILADGNDDPEARWQSISDTLRRGDVRLPEAFDPDGAVMEGEPRVGVWLMPDNRASGELEDFVIGLLPADDPVWPRADRYVEGIPAAERRFRPQKTSRAKIHAWLATRAEPRLMGAAVGAGDLDANAPPALALVGWLRRLFGG